MASSYLIFSTPGFIPEIQRCFISRFTGKVCRWTYKRTYEKTLSGFLEP
jgi:hypothetical protein